MLNTANEIHGKSDFILNFALFQNLDESALLLLRDKIVFKEFSTDQIIYEQGQVSSEIYFLLKGSVDLCSFSSDGREVTLSALGPVSSFGEIGFLDGKPRESNAIARSNVEVAFLKKVDFIPLLQKMNYLSWLNFLYMLCEKNRKSTKAIEDTVLLSPGKQLVRKLIELCENEKKQKEPYIISISHEKLGNMLGLRRESISKHLGFLEDKELVSKSRGSLFINNIAKLKAYEEELGDD